jgi:hypothetical protein
VDAVRCRFRHRAVVLFAWRKAVVACPEPA